MIRLGILGSTRGTNLNAIVEAINNKTLCASIEVVISNKVSAPILEKAANFGINPVYISQQGLSREEFDKQLSSLLSRHHVDFVVLIGYMRILSTPFITTWKDKIINVHPSLLPAFAGLMDLDVHRAVINAAHDVSGCTVHFVTEEVDAGPIIVQKKCPVFVEDSPESLKIRVQQMEGELLVEAIQRLLQDSTLHSSFITNL